MKLDQIIDGCRKGDTDARCKLYELLGDTMYGVVRRYVKDVPTAEDLFHDGFVTLLTKIGDYRGEGSFEGWCRRIFVNTVFTHFRKKNPLGESEDIDVFAGSASVGPNVIDEMSANDIKKCVDELPAGYKMVFNLHAVEGYSYAEIAEIMNITEVTTRSQYSRARAKLAEIIKARYPNEIVG